MQAVSPIRVISYKQDKWQAVLAQRLQDAMNKRQAEQEPRWQQNEQVLYKQQEAILGSGTQDDPENAQTNDVEDTIRYLRTIGQFDASINYTFRYAKFLHSLMAANPPSVLPVPTSPEFRDRRAARVADAFIQYGRRKLKMQENVDLTTVYVVSYGTGVAKTYLNPLKGKMLSHNEKTGEVVMDGEIETKPISIWNIWFDHNATQREDIRWAFELHEMRLDEAIARWPKEKNVLKANSRRRATKGPAKEEDIVDVFEYTEKGGCFNAMRGRHCFHLLDGTILGKMCKNDYPDADLPYTIFSDIDIPDCIYGKTAVDYILKIQDIINRMDASVLANIKAHSAAKIIVFDAAEIQEGAESDDAFDVYRARGAGGQAPFYINPPTLMPDLWRFRGSLEAGMESLAGFNDAMFGQQKRETSSLSMQTAIRAGNMVRHRLFNKYQNGVEDIYTKYLKLVQKHYNTRRKIEVVGKEDSISVAHYNNSDLTNGYSLQVEYGASFSLDPAQRREEILQLRELFIESGYTPRQLLGMMRLNQSNNMVDLTQQSYRRQEEIFDEMIAVYEETGQPYYIEPEENEDHVNMLEAAKVFRGSMEFKILNDTLQVLIDRHINERKEWVAKLASPQPPAPGAQGGIPNIPMPAQPAPGAAPMPAPPLAETK